MNHLIQMLFGKNATNDLPGIEKTGIKDRKKPTEISSDNFEKVVRQSDKTVLVDFWAPWCGPCLMMNPVLENFQHQYNGQVLVGKVNIDTEFALTGKFSIYNIPTILIFKNGEVVDRITGVVSAKELNKRCQPYIES